MRNFGGHTVEVLQFQFDTGFESDGHEVEHGVGRTPEGHDHGNGVLESSPGHDLAGSNALAQQVHHCVPAGEGHVGPPPIDRGSRRRTGQRHTYGLANRGHGVSCEHARTTSDCRTGRAFDGQQLSVVDTTHGVGAHSLEHAHDVQFGTVGVFAGHDRPAIHEHRRHHGLDRVGDDLPADQTGPHPLVTHGNAVRHGDGVELDGKAPGLGNPLLATLGQCI